MSNQVKLGANVQLTNNLTAGMNEVVSSLKAGVNASNEMSSSVKAASSATISAADIIANSMGEVKTRTKGAVDSTKEFASAADRVKESLGEINNSTKRTTDSMGEMDSVSRRAFKGATGELADFVDHLQEARSDLIKMRMASFTFEELKNSIEKTSVAADKLTSVSETGKQGIKVIQELNEVTKQTKMSILGLSNEKISVNTQGATSQLEAYKMEIEVIKSKLNDLKDAGDIASYTAGMNVLNQKMREVEKTIYATTMGGKRYISILKEMGVHTSATANASAIAMEAYKDKFISSLDYTMARTTQSERMFKALGDPTPFNKLTRGCLDVSKSLEKLAKAGLPAKLAIDALGKNASMKDLKDRINMINMGIMRMNMLALGLGVVFTASTAIMAKMTIGPKVDEVLAEEQRLTDGYKQTLAERKQEIYNFSGLFEKVNTKAKASGKDLINALQSQVTSMTNWSNNMKTLAKRGVDEGLIQELQKMGPAAGAQIAALANMTDSELNKYVGLWKQKHNLAKTQATSELEGLKEETKKKIEELKGTLTPLGIAAEKFKSTWATALKPFADLWGQVASVFVSVGTKVGEFINKLNEINPAISKMAGMFLYLLPAVMLVMSPLAIGIGMLGGLKAAFTSVWAIIGPFVTGFLRVLGPATMVTGAIVVVTGVIMKLWQNSEGFRNAFINIWNSLKGAVSNAIAPIKAAIDNFKQAFNFKPKTSFADMWKGIGDSLAPVINKVSSTILPLLSKGFQMAGQAIAAVINFLIPVFQQIGNWWQTNGPMIIQAVKNVADFIGKAFSFILPILKPIFTILVVVIKGAWDNVKSVITSGIGIIQNVITIFAALFTGNWSALWNSIKSLVGNALTFVWNLMQLTFLGKLLGPVKAGMGFIKTAISAGWNFIKSIFSKSLSGIGTVVKGGFNLIRNSIQAVMNGIKVVITTVWNGIKVTCGAIINGIKAVITAAWNAIKAVTSTVWNGIKTVISNAINNVKTAVSTGLNNVKTFFSNTFNSILNTLKSLPGKFMSYGKSIMKGLWDGIKSAAAGMAEKVSGLVEKIVPGPVKKVLGINSPSKLMRQYGVWTMEGLGIGINEKAGYAKDQMMDVSKSIANTPFVADFNSNMTMSRIIESITMPSEKLKLSSGPNVMPGGKGDNKNITNDNRNNNRKNIINNKFIFTIKGGAETLRGDINKIREIAEEVMGIIVEELEGIDAIKTDVTREVLV